MSASKPEPSKRLPFLTDPPADWEKAEAADAPDAHVFAQDRVVVSNAIRVASRSELPDAIESAPKDATIKCPTAALVGLGQQAAKVGRLNRPDLRFTIEVDTASADYTTDPEARARLGLLPLANGEAADDFTRPANPGRSD